MLLKLHMDDLSPHNYPFISEQLEMYASRSRSPFSNRGDAAICVLSNGDWVPGIKIESASYSLTIPSLLNAYTTTRTCNRNDLTYVCSNRPFRPEEVSYLQTLGHGTPTKINACMYGFDKSIPLSLATTPLDPFLSHALPVDPDEGIRLVRSLLERAHIPESNFPVACLLETTNGQLVPGVNIEHQNWSNILCAERNALGTAYTYGTSAIKHIYLTCSKDPQCSPCGACRQLLAELTPEAVLWMDRGLDIRESTTPSSLLPEWFTGSTLKKNTTDC